MSKDITIFISSRFYEFRELRDKIIKERFSKLGDIGLKLNMLDDRDGIADARSPAVMSIEEAGDSDIFILLLGETYKEVQDGEKSYTHQEYDMAIEKNLHILAFPIGDCYDQANQNLSADDRLFREFQEAILVNSKHTTAPFSPSNYDVDEMYEKIYQSLKETLQQLINNGLNKSSPTSMTTTVEGDVNGVVNATNSTINQTIIHNGIELSPPSQLTSKLGKSTIIGRKKELQEIDQQLNSSNTLLLINGIGGVGKSNIASFYLHSHKEQFDYYGFFEGLDSFIVELREPLDLKAEKPHEAFLEALSKLRKLEGDKLLVLDDVKEIEENRNRIDGILALKGSGYKILFTSRSKIRDISKYTLPVLSIDDAIALFVEYYPTKDKKSVEQIVKYLDYHALFVELLAKTVQNEGYSLDEIIEKFKQGELSQIEFIDEKQGDESSFNQNLKELFEMQQQSLKEEYILLLKQLSTLPSIDIELSFLETILGKKRLKGRLNFLVNKGWLINGFGSSYKLHQIIKEYILSNYQPTFEEIEIVVDSFRALMKNSDDAQVAVDNRENIIYFESLVTLLDRLEIENEKVGDFFARFGTIYYHLGLYQKAEPLYLKSLKIKEKVLGEDHPDTAISYNNLAGLYEGMGEYQKAEPLYLKALKIKEVLGEEHLSTVTSYNNLAVLYKNMGEYQKAEPLYLKALKIKEKVLGEEHPSTATSYNNLAGPYQSMGEYQKAEPLYLKALTIREKVLGKEHPDTAGSYNNLAVFYYGQGDYERAYKFMKRAVEVLSKVLPSNHPHLINSKKGLEMIEERRGFSHENTVKTNHK